ncbi:MAG: DUF3313 family protein [Gammaproteobacteria bacterium]
MSMKIYRGLVAISFAFLAAKIAVAQGPSESGFFDDYSNLRPAEQDWVSYAFMADNFREKIAGARALVIPQPEIFLADDSKYKGMKPDDMAIISDTMRALLVDEFSDNYQITNSAGPNTLVIRMGFSNLYLKKKGRMLIGYVPVAFVATTAKRQLLNDFTDNILLTQAAWEAELLDAETGEVLGQLILELGDRGSKKQFTSWDELATALQVGAKRFRCRFDNATVPDPDRRDCFEISEADIGAE